MLTGSLPQISVGTAKTFEHLASKFAFRVEGDGAVEPAILDKFSTEAPVTESVDERKFRAFLKKESAFSSVDNLQRSAEDGREDLQKLATGSLGEGWTVKEFNAPFGGTPRMLQLELNSEGSSQTISIDRYSFTPQLTVGTQTRVDGWNVQHSISASVTDGVIANDSLVESAYLTK